MNLSGLITALQFLTRLPVPRALGAGSPELHRAAPWFPFVGFIVGGAVALAIWAGSGMGPWFGALLGLLPWVIVTGALHLDGLSDVADGLGAAHGDKGRFLEVVRDPHTGAFGVVAIVLAIVAKLVLLAELTQRFELLPLVLVAAWARWGALVLARAVPPLAPGFAQQFAESISVRVIGGWALLLTLLSVVIAPMLVIAVAVPFGLALYWRLRLGGITGDCHGASIEVTEIVLLALLIAWAG